MVLCENDDDFRETWRLLDTHTKTYKPGCTLKFNGLKRFIHGVLIPCHTEAELIIQSFKKHVFIIPRTAILQNTKTGSPKPLYMVNVLPRKNLE